MCAAEENAFPDLKESFISKKNEQNRKKEQESSSKKIKRKRKKGQECLEANWNIKRPSLVTDNISSNPEIMQDKPGPKYPRALVLARPQCCTHWRDPSYINTKEHLYKLLYEAHLQITPSAKRRKQVFIPAKSQQCTTTSIPTKSPSQSREQITIPCLSAQLSQCPFRNVCLCLANLLLHKSSLMTGAQNWELDSLLSILLLSFSYYDTNKDSCKILRWRKPDHPAPSYKPRKYLPLQPLTSNQKYKHCPHKLSLSLTIQTQASRP